MPSSLLPPRPHQPTHPVGQSVAPTSRHPTGSRDGGLRAFVRPLACAALIGCATCVTPDAALAEGKALTGIDLVTAISALSKDAPDLSFVLLIKLLQRNGYDIQSVDVTFLNRARIIAANRWHRREVIVSRTSGEILRDVLLDDSGAGIESTVLPPLPPDYFIVPRSGRFPEVPQ